MTHAERKVKLMPGRMLLPMSLLLVVSICGFLAPGAWSITATTATIQALLALSVGLLFYRIGILVLCPLTFCLFGAWTMCWLSVHTSLPFVLIMLLSALAAAPFGAAIGVVAVRLRGVNLAALTLAFAVAMGDVLTKYPIPGATSFNVVKRPTGFGTDRMYFLYCMLVVIIVGGLLFWHSHSRNGHAWQAVRFSERASASGGLSVSGLKIEAVIIGACIAALGGTLLVGQLNGPPSTDSFSNVGSLIVVALAVMVGSYSASGAVLAGIFAAVLPEVFSRLGISSDYPQMLFGLGAVQVLATGAGGMSSRLPWMRPVRSSKVYPAFSPSDLSGTASAVAVGGASGVSLLSDAGGSPAFEAHGLRVAYGSVVALNSVDLVVPRRAIVGLIGPNGAGKSTFIDAVSGFTDYSGQVSVGGRPVDRLAPDARAKHGLRRTFQHGRAVPSLTVGDYVQVGAGRRVGPRELDSLLGFFDLPPADEPIGFVDVGTRRVLEIAAAVAGRPTVLLLDEPAAGLGDQRTAELGERLGRIPDLFGCAIILVEHHVEMVAALSSSITVLDFGEVLASGDPVEILKNPVVAAAYLGEDIEVPVAPGSGEPALASELVPKAGL